MEHRGGGLRCDTVNGLKLCRLTDVARIAGVHRNALYDAVQRGRVPGVRLFGNVLIPQKDAARYIEQRAKRAARVQKPKGKP